MPLSYLENLTIRLANGVARLPEESRQQHARYFLAAQQPDGGFRGREGASDLYYTSFALRGLAVLASGVSILEALDITARTAGNAIVEEGIMLTRKSIEGGDTIAAPLKETAVFPPMVVQMIGVGEATGALDTMLQKIADFYEEEVDTAVAGMLTLLEPIMIAFLGGVVGGIVIAMYMPIFGLISKLAG